MSCLLAFDTAGPHFSAVVLRDGAVRAQAHEDMARGQAERLVPLLNEVLAAAEVGWPDVTALGVGVGPGNFTGVRISVATARGLALSLGIPAVGVSGFEAAALDVPHPVSAVLAAPRGQVYLQSWTDTASGAPQVVALDAPLPDSVPLRWVGNAAQACVDAFGGAAEPQRYPTAEAIARCAAAADLAAVPRPAPLYVRAADAAPSRDRPPVILD